MHSSRFLIALGFAAFAVTAQAQTTEAPAPETAADPDAKVTGQTVVAIVNGEDITIGDIVALRTELPPQYQSIPDRQLYDGLINQMVNQILLSQAATRAGLEDRPSVKRGLEMQRMSYLAELYARERIDAAITGEAVETEYAQRYAQEEPKLEFNASHILVPEEETAKEIAELARGDADFAELAKERSTGPSGPNGGNLGWFGDGQMVPAFEAGVKELAVGGVSDPIQTQFGWHVIKLLETREKAPPALSEVYQELAGDMARQITDAMVQALREDGSVEFIEGTPGLGSLRDDKLIEE